MISQGPWLNRGTGSGTFYHTCENNFVVGTGQIKAWANRTVALGHLILGPHKSGMQLFIKLNFLSRFLFWINYYRYFVRLELDEIENKNYICWNAIYSYVYYKASKLFYFFPQCKTSNKHKARFGLIGPWSTSV